MRRLLHVQQIRHTQQLHHVQQVHQDFRAVTQYAALVFALNAVELILLLVWYTMIYCSLIAGKKKTLSKEEWAPTRCSVRHRHSKVVQGGPGPAGGGWATFLKGTSSFWISFKKQKRQLQTQWWSFNSANCEIPGQTWSNMVKLWNRYKRYKILCKADRLLARNLVRKKHQTTAYSNFWVAPDGSRTYGPTATPTSFRHWWALLGTVWAQFVAWLTLQINFE